MNDKHDFIEIVRSKGTPRTIKHVISKRKFEEEDIIVVRVLRADTQYQQNIAHLVVEDELPEAKGKKGHPLNVFILGDFPQKDTAFHEGELIALGGGCISQNDEGKLELVFTNDDQNVILREDFTKCNKEDIFSKTAQFPTAGRRLANETLKMIEEIKKWIGHGLVAAVPKELTLNQASLKPVCRCNLACKVLDTREIEPCLGIITVTDGSVCALPFLTINKDKEVEFVSLNESDLSLDIIVTLKTVCLKNLKKGSYIRLYGVQAKTFSLPLSGHKNCVVFKIDGRIFSFESLVGSDRIRVSKILHKSDQHNNTADVSHNIADDSSTRSTVSSSNKSFTILTSGPQQNTKTTDIGGCGGGGGDDDGGSQSIITHRVPPTNVRGSSTLCKIPGKIHQSFHLRHKQHPFSGGKKRESNKRDRAHVDPDDGDSGSNTYSENCKLCRAIPPKRDESRHCGFSAPTNKCVEESSLIPTGSHCAKNCSIAERQPCEASTCVKQSKGQIRSEINAEGTVHDSTADDECIDDEPLVIEMQTGLRRLKYLPSIYHVNVWIKDVSPTVLGCPLDLITAQCYICRKQQSYTRIIKYQPHSEQQICLPCSSQGMPKFLELQFKFTLVLWDACEREISASVTGENAEKFLKCSVYTYIRDEAIRKKVWDTLRKLKNRGCLRSYRRAEDLIEVDIGVTVEKGLKKYMLLGGVLNNLEFSHKQVRR